MQVLIIKLAAIGDVAIASRALNEFFSTLHNDVKLEIHWVIDQNLVPLARSLVQPPPGILLSWYPVNSQKLFQGNGKEKAQEAFSILRKTALLQPKAVLLLHRDWRYRILIRPILKGALIRLSREKLKELDAYRVGFTRLANHLGLKRKPVTLVSKAKIVDHSNSIGVLAGGAQNSKINYREKKWPHLERLVGMLLEKTSKTVFLFGGPEDIPQASALVEELKAENISSERLVNLVGKHSLEELPSVLSCLDAFLSIDSGLAHIAASVMTAPHQKIVTLFGPTDASIWAPEALGQGQVKVLTKSLPCSPCYKNDGNFQTCSFKGELFQQCMTEISPEEVFAALMKSTS